METKSVSNEEISDTLEMVHAFYRRVVLWLVGIKPGFAITDVTQAGGLTPERAQLALRQLCKMGQIRRRATGGYEVTGGPS